MRVLNVFYANEEQLEEFIEVNKLKNSQNILVQIFCGIIDTQIALKISSSIKKKLPNASVIGASTGGEIYEGKMYENEILISFSVFDISKVESCIVNLEDPSKLEDDVRKIISDQTKALIVLSDGLHSNAEELLKVFTNIKSDMIIAGGRAADNIEFKKTFVFNESYCYENACVVASLSGENLIANSEYMLNWNPIGKKMLVSKASANVVSEIDGIKIRDIYKKYLGDEISENIPFSDSEFPLLTWRNGIKVARSPIDVLEDGSFLFGGNLYEGEPVQFAYGSVENMQNALNDNYTKFQNYPAEALFIYSCTARKTLMGKALENEFAMLNALAPSVGFFTYGEYLHSSKINELLNITTTLLLLSESKEVKKKTYNNTYKDNTNRILKALTHLTNVTSKELRYKNKELDRLNDMIFNTVLYTTSDLEGVITSVSKSYEEFTGLPREKLIGVNHNIFRHPDTPDSFYDEMWEKLNNNKQFIGEIKNKKADGSYYWVKTTIDSLYNENGDKIGYSAYREDITEKKKLEFSSTHDTLTGLYNRAAFDKKLHSKIKSAGRYNYSFGFILLDIDNFKDINDKYGHSIGDKVLKELANCLASNIRDDDFLARWGGEEFVIITNRSDLHNIQILTHKLQKAIQNCSFSEVKSLTLSFGLTVYVEEDDSASLIQRADEALYKAKENGRDRFEIL